jgi:hypothetical protein
MTDVRHALTLTALRSAAAVTRHPALHWRAVAVAHRPRNADAHLQAYAERYGIRVETLQRMVRGRFDIPSYRFDRDDALFRHLADRSAELRGASWLDVGAGRGCVSAYLADMLDSDRGELLDVEIERRTAAPVTPFDGRRLDRPDASVDLVLFSYVLHHAADSTFDLLREARRVATRNVLVLEDPKETRADRRWAHRHDPSGTFRGLREWRELFAVTGFDVVHETPLDCTDHSRHLFVLAPA